MQHVTFQNKPRIVDRQLKEIEQERSKGKIDSVIKRDIMISNNDLSQKEDLRWIKLFLMLDKHYLRLDKNVEDRIIYILEYYNASNITIKRSNLKHCYKEIESKLDLIFFRFFERFIFPSNIFNDVFQMKTYKTSTNHLTKVIKVSFCIFTLINHTVALPYNETQ
ncbi:hypothetical protein BpHYR1_015413 [Brachionus plicatilis]|uniref:Uncharacterized protein n=1 Tax=Brachionus plicatilis TaxID=10195 RepID=A0A3M7R223_BRAPC|nr:hypothetical protein BpHYR1_015413 [Brachionus plicatilis]